MSDDVEETREYELPDGQTARLTEAQAREQGLIKEEPAAETKEEQPETKKAEPSDK